MKLIYVGVRTVGYGYPYEKTEDSCVRARTVGGDSIKGVGYGVSLRTVGGDSTSLAKGVSYD